MKLAIQWLHDNQRVNIVLVVALAIIYPLIHDKASQPFYWMVDQLGHKAFHLYLNIFFTCVLISMVYIVYYKIREHGEKKNILIYGIATLFGILAAYLTLMPYRSEGMHFIQYALLGIIVTPLSPSLFYAIVLSTFIGYLDEYYQYFVTQKYYLDFNDLVLNVLASALGVILSYTFWKRPSDTKFSYSVKSLLKTPYTGILLLALIIFFGLQLGLFSVFKESDGVYPLARHPKEDFDTNFWYTVSFKTTWHRIRTYPGLLIMCLIPLLYYNIDKPSNQ
ncbi:MAG: hypothetical protein KJP00_05005 [Bacteroidia bacterium]|nr:hypothetical protein [Bacteroidia bacterium]